MPRLLCLHGFAGSPATWGAVLAELPWKWQAWCPYLFGHGPEPDLGSPQGFKGEVARLVAGLRERGWSEDVHLVGYSLGGRLALGMLAEAPEVFGSAILIGAHPGLTDRRERMQRVRADESWAQLLEKEGMDTFVDRWEALPIFADQQTLSPEIQKGQRTWRRSHDPRGLALAMRTLGLGSMPSYWSALSTLGVPTTVMVGALDTKFLSFAEPMVERLRVGRLLVVPEAGHNVVLGQPVAVARALCEDNQ